MVITPPIVLDFSEVLFSLRERVSPVDKETDLPIEISLKEELDNYKKLEKDISDIVKFYGPGTIQRIEYQGSHEEVFPGIQDNPNQKLYHGSYEPQARNRERFLVVPTTPMQKHGEHWVPEHFSIKPFTSLNNAGLPNYLLSFTALGSIGDYGASCHKRLLARYDQTNSEDRFMDVKKEIEDLLFDSDTAIFYVSSQVITNGYFDIRDLKRNNIEAVRAYD